MKELAGSTGNIMSVPLGGKFIGMVEMAIIVTEPLYRFDGDGSFAKMREPEAYRFMACAAGVKALIQTLQESLAEINRIESALAGVDYKSEAESSGKAEGHQ